MDKTCHGLTCLLKGDASSEKSKERTYYSICDWLKQHSFEIDHNRPWLEMFDQRYLPGAHGNAYDICAPVIEGNDK